MLDSRNQCATAAVSVSASSIPALLEVGARFGLGGPWTAMVEAGLTEAFLIEPDEEECRRLRNQHPQAHTLAFCLGARNERRTVFVTRHPGCSSLLPPSTSALSRFEARHWFEVIGQTETDVHRLDTLVEAGTLRCPTFLHVDVQGSEQAVLEGCGALLENICCIKAELHPFPLYEEEPTLVDVAQWLQERGFRLAGLQPQGPFEGEFAEADCYFVNERLHGDDRSEALINLWLFLMQLRSESARSRDVEAVKAGLRWIDSADVCWG
jgi:FkbM family methyltransferase